MNADDQAPFHPDGMELVDVDIVTVKHLVDALSSLQKAYNSTPNGFVADRCESAADAIRIALRQSGT